jgi:hypothetical protein
MMEAVRTSETSVDNHFTRQYNPEDSSEQEIELFATGINGGDMLEGWKKIMLQRSFELWYMGTNKC